MIIGEVFKTKFHDSWRLWLKLSHNKINYGKILANELAHNIHVDKQFSTPFKQSLKNVLVKILYTNTFCNYKLQKKTPNPKLIFFNEEDHRRDYQEQCLFVEKQFSDIDYSTVLIDKIKKTNRRFDLIRFINKIFLVVKSVFIYFSSHQKPGNTFRSFIFYLDRILYYYDQACNIEEQINWDTLKLVITFSDMKEYSNIVTQIANRKRVKTATLQHAIYSQAKLSNYSQMVINYENFTSNYIFAWGEVLKETMKGTSITPDKILVTGTSVPDFRKRLDERSILPKQHPKILGIILSAEYWKTSNYALLKIGEYFKKTKDYQVNVLFHPSNNIGEYKKDLNFIEELEVFQAIPNISQFMLDQDFLLCHTTTLYFNALMNGKKIYRFEDDDFVDLIGLEDKFSNLESLERLMTNNEEINYQQVNDLLDRQFSKENLYNSRIKKLIND